MNCAESSEIVSEADLHINDTTAEATFGTDNKASAYAKAEKQKRAGGAADIGIIELKMLISAITRFKYD